MHECTHVCTYIYTYIDGFHQIDIALMVIVAVIIIIIIIIIIIASHMFNNRSLFCNIITPAYKHKVYSIP